ncbi:MAG: hypothetical protein JWN04_2411 [Myxococcaceae bacterium]|nr:hypothetical protein [Myxococcaceae bacterium]
MWLRHTQLGKDEHCQLVNRHVPGRRRAVGRGDYMTNEAVGDAANAVIVDAQMLALYATVQRVAPTSLPIVLHGETGVGKEVLADCIHQSSRRAQGQLIKVNCAGLTESVVESELFGHERGAFTGALQAHCGLFEAAHEGTLFLDEIAELPLRTQGKLLRVLESGEVVRVGSSKPRRVDVRLIAATHRDLLQAVELGTFRQDLYFRLNGVTMEIPPLRQRRRELVPLALRFLSRYVAQHGGGEIVLEPDAVRALESHEWPGNIRELRNVIERAATVCMDGRIASSDLSFGRVLTPSGSPAASSQHPPADAGMKERLRAHERLHILEALARTAGNQTEAAKLLGVSRRTLCSKLKRLSIERQRSFHVRAIPQFEPQG